MKGKPLSRRDFAIGVGLGSAAGLAAKSHPNSVTVVANNSRPAILGGTPVRSQPFPEWPVIKEIDEQKFLDSLREKNWCRLSGDITTGFEQKWAELLGVRHAIGVVNGTNALYSALYALDVGPGDEVLVPAYTFVATVNAVVQQYALPVFIDTDPSTQLMDTRKIEAALTADTRCIMPVHMGGNVVDMDGVFRVAKDRNLAVVEDACQAHFAEWNGKRVGSLGNVGCFSFQASKILPCGEGGAVVTNQPELYDRMHAFQNNGRDRVTGTKNGYLHQGSNLRMTEFQAALLLAQLTRFEEQCRNRDANAKRLAAALAESGVDPAGQYKNCTRNTFYVFMARYRPEAFKGLSRDRFLRAIQQEGIPIGAGYKPLNKEPFLEKILQSRAFRRVFSDARLKKYREMNVCPVNDALCKEALFLSQRCLLGGPGDVDQIVGAVEKIKRHAEEIARN